MGDQAKLCAGPAKLGTDKIQAVRGGEEDPVDVGSVVVNWVGGPDLVIQRFFPPMIDASSGQSG